MDLPEQIFFNFFVIFTYKGYLLYPYSYRLMASSKHTICALINLLNTGEFDKFRNKYNKAFHPLDYKYDIQRDFEGVPGLIYISNFLDAEEVTYLQEFISSLDFEPITSAPNSRRVVQFGYTYAYDRS